MADAKFLVTLDRIEPDQHGTQLATLVFDDGEQLILPVDRLPSEVSVGDVLSLRFERQLDETERRRAYIRELQQRLFRPEQS